MLCSFSYRYRRSSQRCLGCTDCCPDDTQTCFTPSGTTARLAAWTTSWVRTTSSVPIYLNQMADSTSASFIYLEDLDLSLRVTHAKWAVCYVASAQAYHASGGTSRQIRARRLFYSLRSRLLYGAKHFSPASAALLFAATLLLEPISRIAFVVCRGSFTELFETVEAYDLLFADLPGILRTALNSTKPAEPRSRRCLMPCEIILGGIYNCKRPWRWW